VAALGRGFAAIFIRAVRGLSGRGDGDPMLPMTLALGAVFLIRSFTESELFYPLVMGPILFWTLAFSAVRAQGQTVRS
jgi:hypothetical protein